MTRPMPSKAILGVAALLLGGAALAEEAAPPPLPALGLDGERLAVLGVSSGGYMATQLAVAYPARYSRLGVFAAGPWGCAQGSLGQALGQCMLTHRGLPEPSELAARHAAYLAEGRVGPPEALARQRVFLWHGEQDGTVLPAVGERLVEQYRDWLADADAQLRRVVTPGAGHGWPVAGERVAQEAPLVDCAAGGSPYLLDCGYDGPGEALAWLYGEAESPPAAPSGELSRFSQEVDSGARQLGESGYLYLPAACDDGEACGLVVALHGCGMATEQVGDAFARHSGLNAWAEAYRLAVLYPQVSPSLGNPQGCWDWWGYDENSWRPHPDHDSRDGRQLRALDAMVERLLSPPEASE